MFRILRIVKILQASDKAEKVIVIITFIIKYNPMDEKDKIIASLRKQLQEANRKISALEQEVALLDYQSEKKEKTVY